MKGHLLAGLILVAALVIGCVPRDAYALDCRGGSCRAGAFTPLARAPFVVVRGVGRGVAKVAAHRREKRQAGELPRQRAARGIASVKPLRRVGKALRFVAFGRRQLGR